jgi:hypothetical protein
LSVAVFVCFSWAIFRLFDKLPSFILYFTPTEIAVIFAYMMAFALLESLAVTGFLVLLGAVLPSKWLKDGFAYKGFVILAIATIDAILFQKFLSTEFPSTLMLALGSILPLALIVVLLATLQSMPRMRSILAGLQDRFMIMSYIYIPIGLICIIAVTFRNLF